MKVVCLAITLLSCILSYGQVDSLPAAPKALVFSFVEQMPQFPGGEKELMKFLQQNIHYPQSAIDKNISGKVVTRFVVNEDGSVSDEQVLRHVDTALDAEAIRVLKLLPKFSPGKQQGKAVKVFYNLPVIFKLAPPDTNSAKSKNIPDSNGIYGFTEILPKFPGGDGALEDFLAKNITYPIDARDKNIQGKVLLQFVLNEDGSVSDVQILRSVYPSLDSEAVRIVKLLPKFTPGRIEGKAVKAYFNLPIMFRLTDWESVVSDSNFIYTFVEVQPKFPGGGRAFKNFFSKNILYPVDAKAQNIEGNVLLKFVVNEDGSVSNVRVLTPLYPSLDAEAVRVAKLLPKFVPGKQNSKPVKTWFTTPVSFHSN